MIASTPTDFQVFAALRSFLVQVLGPSWEVVAAEQNRRPEPKSTTYVVMTIIRQERIETNVDTYTDSKFTASIAADVMTVSAVDPDLDGPIGVGSVIYGPAPLAANTTVTAIITGSGGVGTYRVTPNPQTVPSGTMSAGTEQIMQPGKVTVQLDFHSPKTESGDAANIVSTLMRDDYAMQQFANQQPNYGVVPLYADDAAQRPFINDQQQYEYRWVVEAMLQANVVVSVPQQFADSATVETTSVDAAYPA